jgi:peroxiredoxin
MIFKKLFPSPGFWLMIALAFAGCDGSSAGYSVKVSIKGYPASDSVQMARYEGTNSIVFQTLKGIPEGTVFSGSKPLPAGMYTLKLTKGGNIDFLISDTLHQKFSISADISDLISSARFENSPENTTFLDYSGFLGKASLKQAELRQRMRNSSRFPDSVRFINAAFERIGAEIKARAEVMKKQFPGSTFSLLLKVMSEPVIPEPVVPMMITNREQYIREYYSKYLTGHYYDSLDFSDPRIISFPVFGEKLRFYFQRVTGPAPEMTEPAIEKVMGKAAAHPDVYRFTAKFLFRMFRESASPQSMENAVYVAENFILNDPGKWKDDNFISQIREKVSKARLNPVGKVATDLKLVRPSGELVRLSDVHARATILYFFNPECEACIPVTEKLRSVYEKVKSRGIEVFAVYMDRKTETWKKYIASKGLDWINGYDPSGEVQIEKKYDIYAIPMIYLLDQDKKVTAKDVPVENLESLL